MSKMATSGLFGLFLLVTGCGEVVAPAIDAAQGSDAGIDAMPDGGLVEGCNGTLTPEVFGDCFLRQVCEAIESCGFGAIEGIDCAQVPYFNLENGMTFLNTAEVLTQLVADGRVTFNAGAARDCLDNLAMNSCPFLEDGTEDNFLRGLCPSVVIGTSAAGEACEFSLDCAIAGSRCQTPTGDTDVCGGEMACVEPVNDNTSCNGDDRFCKAGSFCVTGICRRGEISDPCQFSSDCDSVLYCDTSQGNPGDCAAAKPLGSACSESRECQGELACVGSQCREVDTLNDPCSNDASCTNGLYCSDEGNGVYTCRETPSVGDPCQQQRHCSVFLGLSCAPNNTCQPDLGVGAACTEPFGECRLDLLCSNEIDGAPTGACSERLELGATCTSPFHCISGSCGGGVCVVGELCELP